jgi:hypothetical protein
MASIVKALTDYPHAELPSTLLADWVEQQGLDRWWLVDGDPLLSGLRSYPAPARALAADLRRLNRPLLVVRPGNDATFLGTLHSTGEIEPFVQSAPKYEPPATEWVERELLLRWKNKDEEWLLIEDVATTEGEARDAAEREREREHGRPAH